MTQATFDPTIIPPPATKLVQLISFTGKGAPDEQWAAADLLLFTKRTRLEMETGLLETIKGWDEDAKLKELRYMADTIPSSWEFVDYTFLISGVSRAYTHQQVRTRAGSYAQQSLRVVDASDFEFVYTDRNLANPDAKQMIDECLEEIKETYACLISMGQAPEDARGILPTNIATNIVCKFNLRTFVELVRSRSGGRTQAEYQRVIQGMIDEVLKVHPWAGPFLFGSVDRDYFKEIEAFAELMYAGDLIAKGKLLKIVDKMRKEVR